MTELYQQRCIDANRELAEALGWTYHPVDDIQPCTREWQDAQGNWKANPRWTQDSSESFQLMLDHECFPVRAPDANMVAVATGLETMRYAIEKLEGHPDKASALRFAIVAAVLSKLRFDLESNNGEAQDLEHALMMSGKALLD